MATVTGYTAARMKEIEDNTVIEGQVVGDDLLLTRNNGLQINAGNVRGAQGPPGSSGDTAIQIVTSDTRPATPYPGAMIYETDTNRIYTWSGTAWDYRGGMIICTSTTRPANPFQGLVIYETNVNRIFSWDGAVWVYRGGVILCTSTNRPSANLFVGFMIYETDTNKFWIYDGATWNLPKNVAGGIIGAPGIKTSNQSSIISLESDLTNLTTTVTVGAGRRVRVSFQVKVSRTTADGYASVRIKEGTTLLFDYSFHNGIAGSGDSFSGAVLLTPTAGVHTYKLSMMRTTGTGSLTLNSAADAASFIMAEDIGGV